MDSVDHSLLSNPWTALLLGSGIGFVLGILASYTAWWFNAHVIVPQIKFADKIVKREFASGDTIYQVSFENAGRRQMIDLEILARIGIEGYKGATGWAYHAFRTNVSRIPELGNGEKSRRVVRVFDTRERMQFVDTPSKTIRDALLSQRTLEGALGLGGDGIIQVHVFGHDSFSGTRRLLSSKDYRLSDIEVGRFEGLNVVKDDRASEYH